MRNPLIWLCLVIFNIFWTTISHADTSPSNKSIAESELNVDQLTEVNESRLHGVLSEKAKALSPNQFFTKLNLGSHALTGRRALQVFESHNYGDVSTHPFASLELQWQYRIFETYFTSVSAEAGFASVKYSIRPASGVTTEQARMNSTVFGVWTGVGRPFLENWTGSLLLGYRQWTFRQSSSSDFAVFSENATSLQFGLETGWSWSKNSGLTLRLYTTDTLEKANLAPSSQMNGMLSLAHRI